jgi:hypothetical protein
MIDHLGAATRLADARARQQIAEGRGRPARFELVSAIHDGPSDVAPTESTHAAIEKRRAPWKLRWPRRLVAASRA